MKRCKRILAFICALVLLATSITPLSVSAYTLSDDDNEKYNAIMSTAVAPYLMTCQPDDAIVLTPTVELTPDMLSGNYYGGVVQLPRLSANYYYELGSNTNFYLYGTVYPVLCWKTAAVGQSVTLNIKHQTTQSTVTNGSITIMIQSRADTDMNGTDYFYPKFDVIDPNDRQTVLVPARDFTDCSENLVTGLVDAGDAMRTYNCHVTLYDHNLHKTSIVMDNYVVTPDLDYACLADEEYSTASYVDMAYNFKRQDVGMRGVTTTNNVKDFLGSTNTGMGTRAGLLFAGSKFEDSTFDTNTGKCTTVTLPDDTETLYYFIATSSKCYYGLISTDTFDSNEYTTVSDTAPTTSWLADTAYYLDTNSTLAEAGFDELSDADYMGYGPVSFDSFYRIAPNYGVSLRTGKYGFTHSNKQPVDNLNVFAETLIYAGALPHLATATLVPAPNTVTVNYYYRPSTDTTGNNWKLLDTKEYNVETFSASDLPSIPTVDYYTATGWYIDTGFVTELDFSTLDKSRSYTLNLYAGYTYTGGMYTVQYYNDYTKESVDETYRIIDLPVTPTPSSCPPGYSFKNWLICNSTSDATGVPYSSTVFHPNAGATYVFKTNWDVSGIILRVLTDKTTYYVGQQIDKSSLQVWVQDSSDSNNQRILEQNEYTIDKTVVDKAGTFSFNITYTKSGAVGYCEVNALDVEVTGIEATYKKSTCYVGSTLSKSDFDVNIKYNSGELVATNEFTINPEIINTEGENSIEIKYMDWSTTVVIKAEKNPNSTKLASISAEYTGTTLKVGNSIPVANLKVTAKYGDGSSRILESNEFSYSPTKVSSAGTTIVRIQYSGLSTTTKVTVEASQDATSGNGNSNGNSNSDSSNTGNTGTNSGNNTSSGGSDSGNGNGNGNSNGNGGNGQSTGTGFSSSNSNASSGHNDLPDETGSSSNSGSSSVSGSSSSNVSSNSGGSNSNSSIDEDPTLPNNTLYLGGNHILTNSQYANGSTVSNNIDIEGLIDATDDDTTLTISLVNGAAGNNISSTMLSKLKDRNIHLSIHMVSPTDHETVVADWEINGPDIDNTITTIDPNVTFEVTDKDSDRLVYFGIASAIYPAGITLDVTPLLSNFDDGELVRLYACDLSMISHGLLTTVAWSDVNTFPIDIYSNVSYCLSNASMAYETGDSLLDENGLPSIADDSDTSTGEEFNWEDDTTSADSDFDWDDGTESTNTGSKTLIPIVIVVLVLVVIGCLLGAILLSKRMKASQGTFVEQPMNGYSDGDYSSPNNFENEFEEESDGDYSEPELSDDESDFPENAE